MESNRFDALAQHLVGGSRLLPDAPRHRRGALAALVGGTLGLASLARADAKKKKKKCKKKTAPTCPAGQTCQTTGGTGGTTCPTGRILLSNGTCATTCASPGTFVEGGCQCTTGTNTEGQNLLTPSVAVAQCGSLTRTCNSTAECPVGTMCLSTGCGGANPRRCHAVCA